MAIIFHGFKINMPQEDNFWYYHYDKNVKYFHPQRIMMPWNLPVLPNANLQGTRSNVISISLIFYPVFIDHFGINWPTVEDYLPWSNLDRAGYKFMSLTVLWRKASTTTTASTLFDRMHDGLDSMSQLVPMHRNHIVTTKCIRCNHIGYYALCQKLSTLLQSLALRLNGH